MLRSARRLSGVTGTNERNTANRLNLLTCKPVSLYAYKRLYESTFPNIPIFEALRGTDFKYNSSIARIIVFLLCVAGMGNIASGTPYPVKKKTGIHLSEKSTAFSPYTTPHDEAEHSLSNNYNNTGSQNYSSQLKEKTSAYFFIPEIILSGSLSCNHSSGYRMTSPEQLHALHRKLLFPKHGFW